MKIDAWTGLIAVVALMAVCTVMGLAKLIELNTRVEILECTPAVTVEGGEESDDTIVFSPDHRWVRVNGQWREIIARSRP